MNDFFRKMYAANLRSFNIKLALQILCSPSRLIGFVALHTFGISLIYPGSTSFLFYLSKIIFKLHNNKL